MFNKRKVNAEKQIHGESACVGQPDNLTTEEMPEWEEIIEQTENEETAGVQNDEYSFVIDSEDERAPSSEMPLFAYPYVATEQSVGDIDLDGGKIDINAFPAMRMAMGVEANEDQPEIANKTDENRQEYSVDEDGFFSLIQRYAELDEQLETEEIEEEVSAQEMLPELFRREHKTEESKPEEDIVQEDTEFTMESELEKQKAIAGQLFDYIDVIELEAKDEAYRREMNSQTAVREKVYDPYNLSFNNRYDDTEDVLESTPVIPMEPKYRMEE